MRDATTMVRQAVISVGSVGSYAARVPTFTTVVAGVVEEVTDALNVCLVAVALERRGSKVGATIVDVFLADAVVSQTGLQGR